MWVMVDEKQLLANFRPLIYKLYGNKQSKAGRFDSAMRALQDFARFPRFLRCGLANRGDSK
jgi:hypothetical protein